MRFSEDKTYQYDDVMNEDINKAQEVLKKKEKENMTPDFEETDAHS